MATLLIKSVCVSVYICHSKWRRSCRSLLLSLKSSLMAFRRLSIERNVFMNMCRYSDIRKKLNERLFCEIQLQLSRTDIVKWLRLTLFERLKIIFFAFRNVSKERKVFLEHV